MKRLGKDDQAALEPGPTPDPAKPKNEPGAKPSKKKYHQYQNIGFDEEEMELLNFAKRALNTTIQDLIHDTVMEKLNSKQVKDATRAYLERFL